MELVKVLENIQLLQSKLRSLHSFIKDDIMSVMIDGSIARGDFINGSSDIDITITTVNKEINNEIQNKVLETIEDCQKRLPIREYPQKPLMYDIHWQDINTVIECGKRDISEWNANNIPEGYPKIWLYAFDTINNHFVIYGEDVTSFYTKINPMEFTSIRMKGLEKSVMSLGNQVSKYDFNNGTITQIKSAWETIKCVCIEKGLLSVRKTDVFIFCLENLSEFKDMKTIEELYLYLMKGDKSLLERDFRNMLYQFSLDMINKYSTEKPQRN